MCNIVQESEKIEVRKWLKISRYFDEFSASIYGNTRFVKD